MIPQLCQSILLKISGEIGSNYTYLCKETYNRLSSSFLISIVNVLATAKAISHANYDYFSTIDYIYIYFNYRLLCSIITVVQIFKEVIFRRN